MSNLKAIGRRVRDLRRAEGTGQEELAATIGVSRSTIAGIETGGDRGGIETMIAIADHYKVPMDWLLGRNVPPGSPPVGKLINRPDQIAIIDFWDSLSFEDKKPSCGPCESRFRTKPPSSTTRSSSVALKAT